MNDVIFFKSFAFLSHRFKTYHHTDMTRGTTCYHIGYLKQGRAVFVCDEEKHEFCAGDAFFIPCGCKYRSYWYGSEDIEFDSYAFTYMPVNTLQTYKLQPIPLSDKAREYMEKLTLSKSVSPASVGLLYLFLGETLPAMEKNDQDKKAELVAQARRYMLKHNDYSVPDIARYCKVSESAIYGAFRDCAGHTPIEEKHRMQTEKAIRLLVTTDMSVEQISDLLGFSSASYMRKILKAKTGKTPKQIRARHDMQL